MTQKINNRPVHFLTLDVCSRIFEEFKRKIEFNEPIPYFSSRFEGRLESILSSVRQTYQGKLLNPTIGDCASAYFNQIIRGHPFKNGNKRLTVVFTHYFLINHGIDYTLSHNEMYYFAIAVAKAGEKGVSFDETREWCREVITQFTTDAKI